MNRIDNPNPTARRVVRITARTNRRRPNFTTIDGETSVRGDRLGRPARNRADRYAIEASRQEVAV